MIYTVDEIERKLTPICEKFNVKEMYLFGSYAKGKATERSDIDLYVDSGLKGILFFGLLEAVNNALKKDVDLIDRQDLVVGSNIEKEIMQTGVKVYERKRQRNPA